MKKNSGFTLIELLVTMVVLLIITGISIPLIHNIEKNLKEKKYLTYVESMKYSAKLFVDWYEDDLFVDENLECAVLRYSDMSEKRLIKDISLDGITCKDNSFVKVVKFDNKYSYAVNLICINEETGKEEYKKEATTQKCFNPNDNKVEFSTNPSKIVEAVVEKNIRISISTVLGIKDGVDISYGFSTTEGEEGLINNLWKKLDLTVPSEQEQVDIISHGEKVSIFSDVTTPKVTGNVYLLVKVNTLKNINGVDSTKP